MSDLAFSPLLPAAALAVMALVMAAGLLALAARAPRLLPGRTLLAVLVLLALCNPVQRRELRESQRDTVLLLVDRSGSMRLPDRRDAANTVAQALQRERGDIDLRVEPVGAADATGTQIAAAAARAIGEIPPDRLAATLIVTDGQIRDNPGILAMPAGRPLHLLLAGDPDITDRRLIVAKAPPYAVVGKPARIRVLVDDGKANASIVRLDWQIDGVPQPTLRVRARETVTFDVVPKRRGPLDVSIRAEPADSEATLVNNERLLHINAVREQLRVLLVSGAPYPGARVWRDTLKSDPAIDLVHFTILRLPTSFDPTPPEQMALIPFPVDELFGQELPSFDLIIFDRFGLSELLEDRYFNAIRQRVEAGGALLVVTGSEYVGSGGLAATPIARLLPAAAQATPRAGRFRPALTGDGRIHPVTAAFAADADWGDWGERVVFNQRVGRALLEGEGAPLLVLAGAGRGRVGLLASTDIWWWARDVAGTGPQTELLRRVAHWLMQEPDLEERQLDVSARGRRIGIGVRGLDLPGTARVTDPGGRTGDVRLVRTSEGRVAAGLSVARDGIFTVTAGSMRRQVQAGSVAEFDTVRPRAAPLDDVARRSGGGVFRLADGLPAFRRVAPGDRTHGPGWAGLVRGRGALTGIDQQPLLPPLAWALTIAAAAGFSWWRERR